MNNRLTAREREHLGRVKALPCSICDAPGPSEAHHIKQGHQFTAVALCPDCHRGGLMGWHGLRRFRVPQERTDGDVQVNEVGIIAALIAVAIGAAAMLRTIGTLSRDEKRLNALQDNGWQVGHIDGHFAVLGGSPPKIIGSAGKDLRDVIDHAVEVTHG